MPPSQHAVWFVLFFLGCLTSTAQGQIASGESMRAYLQSRTAAQPTDASAWRMLGSLLLQRGDLVPAGEALERATLLDPLNSAAHFDLGRCLLQQGFDEAAAGHLREVTRLAPESDYARRALEILPGLPAALQVQPASYDVRRLDGSTRTRTLTESAQAADDPRALYFKLELGATYNSNVTLTPVSREFGSPERESAQGFFNPLMEYRIVNNDFWSVGPSFAGYFSLNENDALRNLNLQSFQPGCFAERTVCLATTILVPRVQYDYTLDQFDGVTFGQRHGLTASLTSLWDRGDTSVFYWSTNHTDFTDDGVDPATSSRDGWTYSTGISHSWPLNSRISALTIGGDLEWADVQGSDFAYFGGSFYAAVDVPITDTLWCDLEAGLGRRDYYAATLIPSRNETLWRGSLKVTQQFSEHLSLAGILSYDQFASENALFAADRFIAGILTSFEY